ncbi:MAG: triose-phosphate isomerase [Candidatus Pacebacteria bacterium]|nr:triose-phosphate isomerase [Candidatus Paceibacterota bacterium]
MKKLIIANWKMNPSTLREARRMFLALKAGVKSNKSEVVVCPPFVYLAAATEVFKSGKIRLGAQDCFWAENGPYTGEVSASMLKSIGVKYVILGHSEKRAMGENSETVGKKIKAVLKSNLTPVVCVGETAEQKQKGDAFAALEEQAETIFGGLSGQQIKNIVMAYEPVWAISTAANSRSCPPDEALTAILFLRKLLAKTAGPKAGQTLPVLYGGSVDESNADDYLRNEAVSGLLAGGVSLNVKKFLKISQSKV